MTAAVQILEDPEAVASAAAQVVAAALNGGAQSLVLAGGSTPRRMYEMLARMDVEWGRVNLLFGDERCVAPTAPESNFRMVKDVLLGAVEPGGILRMPGELGAEAAASLYDAAVGRLQPLDLVLLGMGPDGHCASLFPGDPALLAPGWAVAVTNAPKPPRERVSLTLGCFRNARRVIFLVTGADKAEAFRAAQRGEVPAGMIPGAEWFVDRAVAA
ncbi:MAG: 6-phosphogluconolactonase [Candidatus Dormibacteraeota bacterium]|nr:6-phosphogluconolactonase [Candidatus Dormibacteraeota bacterium]